MKSNVLTLLLVFFVSSNLYAGFVVLGTETIESNRSKKQVKKIKRYYQNGLTRFEKYTSGKLETVTVQTKDTFYTCISKLKMCTTLTTKSANMLGAGLLDAKASGKGEIPFKIKKLNKTKTIAGRKCSLYSTTASEADTGGMALNSQVCVASAGKAYQQACQRNLGSTPNNAGFREIQKSCGEPMQLETTARSTIRSFVTIKTNISFRASKVLEKNIANHMFTPPKGYRISRANKTNATSNGAETIDLFGASGQMQKQSPSGAKPAKERSQVKKKGSSNFFKRTISDIKKDTSNSANRTAREKVKNGVGKALKGIFGH